ncbi:MAG: hypothetical protein IPM29_30570 [Planctomycetes bacterium]|nr:hypothetical protein [Planctomycetota bacterium]
MQAHVEELADEQKVYPVLLLDDAHLLPIALLDYRTDSRAVLSVIPIGLPEPRGRLARNVLSSLSTRLPGYVHLEPLAAEQIGT